MVGTILRKLIHNKNNIHNILKFQKHRLEPYFNTSKSFRWKIGNRRTSHRIAELK